MRRPAGSAAYFRLTVILTALGCVACGHVLHPAAVVPGPIFDIQIGVEIPEHRPISNAANSPVRDFDPYRSGELLVQLNLGYGWRFSQNQAVQVTLSGGSLSAPALDLYWQFLGGPLDAGAGATAGLAVLLSGYVMAGRGFSIGQRNQLRLDGGYRFIPGVRSVWTAHGPIALISFVSSPVGFGLWLDQLWFSKTIFGNNCDDLCEPDDTVAKKLSAGAFFRLVF